MAERTYDRVAGLPLLVESYELERLERPLGPEFTRVTTVVRLRGGGAEGVGEDVTYDGELHRDPPRLPLEGEWGSLDAFSRHLDGLDLFGRRDPGQHAYLDYRRWAYESAALDLALRQAGVSLGGALGREARPLRYVVSLRLPDPPTLAPIERLRRAYPELRFKLDPTSDWTEELIAALAALASVDVVDLKGQYRGTPVDQEPDPELYRRVAEAFPEALIEDPNLDDPACDAALEPYRDRITWDAPIHAVADVEALPFPPRVLNVKPSRFGPVHRLFDFYDYCSERGIALYGGGQTELGPGRGQIQYLGSLFHPDGPNDTSPGEFNSPAPPEDLPRSPLDPRPRATGFFWHTSETDA